MTIQQLGVSSMLESFKSNSMHNRLFFPGNFVQMQNVYLYGNLSRFSCHFEILFREDSYVCMYTPGGFVWCDGPFYLVK